jgi:hypothetical protein
VQRAKDFGEPEKIAVKWRRPPLDGTRGRARDGERNDG